MIASIVFPFLCRFLRFTRTNTLHHLEFIYFNNCVPLTIPKRSISYVVAQSQSQLPPNGGTNESLPYYLLGPPPPINSEHQQIKNATQNGVNSTIPGVLAHPNSTIPGVLAHPNSTIPGVLAHPNYTTVEDKIAAQSASINQLYNYGNYNTQILYIGGKNCQIYQPNRINQPSKYMQLVDAHKNKQCYYNKVLTAKYGLRIYKNTSVPYNPDQEAVSAADIKSQGKHRWDGPPLLFPTFGIYKRQREYHKIVCSI